MDPATRLAGTVAAVGAAYLVAALLLDGVRRLARVDLPGLPSLRPLLAAIALLAVLGRMGPAAATTPPPAQRLGGGGGGAAPTVDMGEPIATAVTLAPSVASPAPGSRYMVEPGDSLWTIARRALGGEAGVAAVASYWPLVHEANAAVIGADPDLIHPGQVLELPEAP